MTVDLSPATAVATNGRFFGDQIAVIHDSGELTYRQLEDAAARLAAVLRQGGVGEGDRVAYVGLNSATFITTMLATFRIGAVYVPVNFRLAGPELQQVLEKSGAVVAVVEAGHREAVEHIREQTALRLLLLVDDDPLAPVDGIPAGWESLSSALQQTDPLPECLPRSESDLAILMFTSGTTGLPKGVMLTYGNVWWNAINVDSRLETTRGDVTYAAAPLFHIGALNSFVLRLLARGGTVVVRRAFDPEQCLHDLVDLKVNTTFVVPAMLGALSRVPAVFDTPLPDLRSVVVAGAPVPPSMIERYHRAGIVLQQAWGLTETAPFATHLPAEDTLRKLGSAGIPMPYNEVRVIDSVSAEPTEAGAPGELVVRGPNVSPGYWNNPEATAAAYDDDGWFHTGDIGYLDEDGYLFIVDRLKDMIISGGENVYPAEVERALAAMPQIGDVAVIGVPDPQWGETVVAIVSLHEGAELTLEEVRDFAAERIARYKLPRRLEVVTAVPRNASGKLDKVAIRQSVGGR